MDGSVWSAEGDESRLDPFTLHLTHAPICAADPLCAIFFGRSVAWSVTFCTNYAAAGFI